MNKFGVNALLGLLLVSLSPLSFATGITAQELRDACNSRKSEHRGMCAGYINGVMEANKYWGGRKNRLCMTSRQARFRRILKTVKWELKVNSKLLPLPAPKAVMQILKANYPCNK